MMERDLTNKTGDAFSAITGFTADPVVVTDSSGQIVASNHIVEQHTGIRAEEENLKKGQGTTFIITLPDDLKNENGGENIWINNPESSLSTTTKQSAQQ
jgi:hypothetical protein